MSKNKFSPKSTNHIVSINNELYNCLNDVNYGVSKPQFHHISTIVDELVNSKEQAKKMQG